MTLPTSAADDTALARTLTARQDRLDVWALSYTFIAIIGAGFLFTFFDIFDINVSFVQTCVEIKAGCSATNALGSLTLPVVLNLAGYVVGTLVLSPMSDRVGRRNMLLITMLLTGLGSLYTAFTFDMVNFDIARIVTGMGVGADLAIVNTYIGEVAPRRGRAKFTAVIFTLSAVGAFLGIWLGLWLTTPATAWPLGLPFALAGPGFASGWRWMYGFGALLALLGLLMRVRLPESPRWLVSRGRLAEANEIVVAMEARARRHGPLAEPVLSESALSEPAPSEATAPRSAPRGTSYRQLAGSPVYVRRVLVLLLVWLIGYMTVYGFASGFTSVLTTLRYPPPEAGIIVSVGTIGFIIQGLAATWLVEKLERRYWLPIGAIVTLAGAVLVAEAGQHIYLAFLGAIVTFFGFNVWVSPTYALSAESFPTRARASGFAVVDGIGHLGGGVGVLVIAHYITHLDALGALLLIASFQVVAAVLVQFTQHTRGRPLDEVSP